MVNEKALTTTPEGKVVPLGTAGAKQTPHNAEMVIADISSSMSLKTVEGPRRIECLRKALEPLKGQVHILAFCNDVIECDPDVIPEPYGGTMLEKALDHALSLEPTHVLVISDGEPNHQDWAIAAGKRLAKRCIIDTLFVGQSTNLAAKDFMRELAEIGQGNYTEFDLNVEQPGLLGSTVESLLSLPAPEDKPIQLG